MRKDKNEDKRGDVACALILRSERGCSPVWKVATYNNRLKELDYVKVDISYF